MVFAFDDEIAKVVGVPAAVVFNTLAYWILYNESAGKNFFDGRYWTYNSAKGYTKTFPFFTESQIRRALAKLVDSGFLVTGCYNAVQYDRTTWYSFGPRGQEASNQFNKNVKSNSRIRDFDLTKSSNRFNDSDGPIPETYQHDTNKEPVKREGADAPPAPAQATKGNGKKAPVRHKFGAYQNVLLSDEERAALERDFPLDLSERIERLSEYMASSGRTYKSHAATLRVWARRDDTERKVVSFGKPQFDYQPDPAPKIRSAVDDLFV